MIKKLFKTGVTAAAGWVGDKIGGSTGRNIATKAVGSLFSKDGGSGGDFQLQTQNPNDYEQNFGGRLGFERSDETGSTGVAKTVDGKDLNYEWERRLMTAMSKNREYKKDLT